MRNLSSLFLIGLFLVIVISCQRSRPEVLPNEEANLKLSSDNGFKLAKTVSELKNSLNPIIFAKNQPREAFKITQISYYEYGKYTYAMIDYTTEKGDVSNLIITNRDLSMNAGISKTNEKCENCDCYSAKCTGESCCRVRMIIGTTEPTFECTCSNCTMDVQRKKCNN